MKILFFIFFYNPYCTLDPSKIKISFNILILFIIKFISFFLHTISMSEKFCYLEEVPAFQGKGFYHSNFSHVPK